MAQIAHKVLINCLVYLRVLVDNNLFVFFFVAYVRMRHTENSVYSVYYTLFSIYTFLYSLRLHHHNRN